MKVFLVRHGETDWNKELRIQGQTDIPLNEAGRMLAEKTAAGLSDIQFDRAYTSPLSRARETAEIILKGKTVELIEEPLITEMNFGIYEGKRTDVSKGEIPEEFGCFFEYPGKYEVPPKGESFERVKERMQEFLTELSQTETNQTVLIVTHGAALAGMLNVIKREPLEKYWGTGIHYNCGVTEVVMKLDEIWIVSENKIYYEDRVEPWETLGVKGEK